MRIGEFALDVETGVAPKPATAASTLRGDEATRMRIFLPSHSPELPSN